MKKIVLASQSPRRKELLHLIVPDFSVHPSGSDEIASGTDPAAYVKELALMKAQDVAEKTVGDCIIIGADTIVVLDGEILGKPKNEKEAHDMLKTLSGQIHEVFTGVALYDRISGGSMCFSERTEVEFYPLSDKEIADYIATGEPFDKAGGYGIQGHGAYLVKGIKGDYFNVVGLPVASLARHLQRFNHLINRSLH